MAVTTLPKNSYKTEDKLVLKIEALFPQITLKADKNFSWSPKDSTVYFNRARLLSINGKLALLHELGHALLGHSGYSSDVDLLLKEVSAWKQAEILASKLHVSFDSNHVEDCLDTYRDWLHKRSTCPTCLSNALQSNPQTYQCLNCQQSWHVSISRFCRSYRLKDS